MVSQNSGMMQVLKLGSVQCRGVVALHAVSAYKKRLYKKRLVDGSIVKKRTLVDFYQAKKLVSYIHSQKLLR